MQIVQAHPTRIRHLFLPEKRNNLHSDEPFRDSVGNHRCDIPRIGLGGVRQCLLYRLGLKAVKGGVQQGGRAALQRKSSGIKQNVGCNRNAGWQGANDFTAQIANGLFDLGVRDSELWYEVGIKPGISQVNESWVHHQNLIRNAAADCPGDLYMIGYNNSVGIHTSYILGCERHDAA